MCLLLSRYIGIIDDLIHMDAAEVILATKLVAETTLHERLLHLWVVNWKAWHCGIVVRQEACIIHLVMSVAQWDHGAD